jgi:hypothetical protein
LRRTLSTKKIQTIEQRITAILNTSINLTYDPQFPLPDGRSFRLFQIVYVVGPDTNTRMRSVLLDALPALLELLVTYRIDRYADTIAVRVRAHTPTSSASWPHMFFEVFWDRDAFTLFRKGNDVARWHDYARTCINHFDAHDPLSRETREMNHDS